MSLLIYRSKAHNPKIKIIISSILFFGLVTCYLLLVTFTNAQCQSNDRNQGLISATQGIAGNTIFGNAQQVCITETQDASYREFKVPSYQDLEDQFYTFSRSSAKKTEQPGLTGTNLTFSGNGIYLQPSNMAIDSVTGNGVQIIFVRGNLNVNGNINYADTDSASGLVFVVSGDINIASTVTKVNAVLISSGKICTAYDILAASCSNGVSITPQLTINGSLISLNKTDLGDTSAILFTRNLTTNNQPAEIINKQPKYLYILRNNLFTKDLIITTEDSNYAIPSPLPSPLPAPSITPPSPSPSPSTLMNGLLAYWKFDNGSGTVITDSSGNGKNGTFVGSGVHWTTGKIGGGGTFNGANDNAVINGLPDNVFAVSWTQSFWIKATTTLNKTIAEKGGNVAFVQTGINSGQIRAGVTNLGGLDYFDVAVSPPFNNGEWRLLTVTFDGPTKILTVYIDGVNRGSITTPRNATSDPTPYVIGKRYTSASGGFGGQVDEAGIWNRALTPSEVLQLYNGGSGRTLP